MSTRNSDRDGPDRQKHQSEPSPAAKEYEPQGAKMESRIEKEN